MPCIPISEVGTLWEASQNVGMAAYKTGFLCVGYNGILPVIAVVFYLLNASPLKNERLKVEGNPLNFPSLQS